ncbi:efflux RND transporter periplasmic adaptor subunit [Luteimonas sp. XNQY3]|nr:efflux RND transporter periplasmic adaptor subunit [Luteimonas sp. XNQY3]MCD9004971.1 efflux RND transporter periplasmic adaptor subunit [Luteimonas sp. XNQY3]
MPSPKLTASAAALRRRRITFVLAGAALLVLGAAAWGLMSRTAPPPPAPSLASLSVTAMAPRDVQWARTIEASGVVAPWQEAIIGAQTSGLSIARLEVAVGDVVQRGQLLARFDTATLRAEAAQLVAALTQAQGVAAQADANRTRALQLQDSGGISEQEVQRYVTEAITAKAQVAAAQAQLAAKRLQLRQADVVAPDDGVISDRTATLGAVANNGQELFRLVRQGRLEWRGEFTATQIASIAIGQDVTLQLAEGRSAKARVRQIAPLLDTRSRLGLVYADIEPGSLARGGMYIDGRIALAPSAARVVPASSVVVRDGHSIVFRLESAGKESRVQAQSVTVGRRQGTEVEILDALAAGERIVAQGAGLLADGDTVRVEQDPSEASASASAGGER